MRTVAIGVSHWHSERHILGFRAAGAEVVAVQDVRGEIAEREGRRLDARSYHSLDELLEREQPDFALVLGEPRDMVRSVRALIDRQIPFMSEKPVAPTSAEVAELARAAERADLFAAVAFVNRSRAIWRVGAELADDGRLGRRSHFAARMINGPPGRYVDWNSPWMLDPDRAGGGALHNLGIHAFDAFLSLTGADPDAIEVLGVALSNRAHGEPIEDYGAALLRAPDGLLATIEAGYTYPVIAAGMTRGGDNAWRLVGAAAYLEEVDETLAVTWPDGSIERHASVGNYPAFCRDTFERRRDGRPPIAGLADCARAVRLIERVYAAAPQ